MDKDKTLTDEDQDLWEAIKETTQPLAPSQKKKHADKKRPSKPFIDKQPLIDQDMPFPRYGEAPLDSSPPTQQREALPTRRLRRLKNLPIEARLDLHGYTQQQAYCAVCSFIETSYQSGKRWVLVITGKGILSGRLGEGVLQTLVPRWLDEPALREMIIGYTSAKLRDGGTGALYVNLKK